MLLRIVKLISAFIILMSLLQCSNKSVSSSKVPDKPLPPPPNPYEKRIVASTNEFAFDLFREISTEEGSKNIFISPFSVSFALGMTYNGAGGATAEALRRVLGYGEMTNQQINDSYKNLMGILTQLDPRVLFEIANSIWCRNTFTVEPDFINVNRNYFDAEVTSLDFDDPGATDIINNWVAGKTHDRIKEIIAPPINSQTVIFLINAIYFKGSWTYEFDKDYTRPAPFYLSNGAPDLCQMMQQRNVFSYLFNKDFQAIDLPYGNAGYSMTVFLPRAGKSVEEFIGQFNAENWNQWINAFDRDTITLSMPKFKLGYKLKLNDALSALGMGIAFSPFGADFTGINRLIKLYVSKALHKTFIQVDEEGTEASAVTAIEIGFTAITPEREMVVNRPFVVVIHENSTGSILFMGKIVNPVWETE